MTTTTNTRPATEKQIEFIKTLISERDLDQVWVPGTDNDSDAARSHGARAAVETARTFWRAGNHLNDATAKFLIEVLKKAPHKASSEQAEPGYYVAANGDFVVVVQNREKTRTYAKRLVVTETEGKKSASWEYAPGVGRTLADITPMTLAEAAQWGHAHGICAICCKTLTDPKSVERGIGPKCAKKVGVATTAPAKVIEIPKVIETKTHVGANHSCEDYDGECCHSLGAAYVTVWGPSGKPGGCTPGQVCKDILQQCSKHSWEYQNTYGRAANE